MYHEIEFACDLSIVAWKSYERGNVDSAKALYKRALRLFQKSKGKKVAEVVSVLNRLGLILESNREYREAFQCFQRAHDIAWSVDGDRQIQRLKVRSTYHVGRIRSIQGLSAEAESFLKKAVNQARTLLGEQDMEYALALNQFAMHLRQRDRFQEARALYYRALRVLEGQLPSCHPRIASIYHNLSDLEFAAGRFKKGEPFARRAILIRMSELGPEHPDLAPDLSILGALLMSQGKFSEAEKLLRRALALVENHYGEHHYRSTLQLMHLANLYRAKGSPVEAEWFFWQALTIKQRELGENHLDCAVLSMQLADLYKAGRRTDEAELLYRRALSVFEKTLEPDHPYVAHCKPEAIPA